MYIIYAVKSYKRDAAARWLKPFGVQRPAGKKRIDWGVFLDLVRLNFDECSADLVTTLRIICDDWDVAYYYIDEIIETDCPDIQEMLATPDPTQPSLSWCVRVFKERYARTDNFWKALGACGATSSSFLSFCRAKGVAGDCEEVTDYFGDKRHETPDFPRECHTVARVGNIYVDWTYRQFVPDGPYPKIWVNRGTPSAFQPR